MIFEGFAAAVVKRDPGNAERTPNDVPKLCPAFFNPRATQVFEDLFDLWWGDVTEVESAKRGLDAWRAAVGIVA
jgi:hypothetical protein